MASIQSSALLFELSSDAGVTYKTLVCATDVSVNGETGVTETETFCGNIVGLGLPKVSFDVNAVCETAPTVSQVSHEDVIGWWVGKTALKYRMQTPTSGTPGGDFYLQGDCYVTNVGVATAVNDVVKFNVTFTGNGVPDVTP